MKQFIVIITAVVKDEFSSNAVLFSNFKDAWEYAEIDAKNYKHLSNEYKELKSVKHIHGKITLKGKHIHKVYEVKDLSTDSTANILDTHLNTYSSFDYLPGGKML